MGIWCLGQRRKNRSRANHDLRSATVVNVHSKLIVPLTSVRHCVFSQIKVGPLFLSIKGTKAEGTENQQLTDASAVKTEFYEDGKSKIPRFPADGSKQNVIYRTGGPQNHWSYLPVSNHVRVDSLAIQLHRRIVGTKERITLKGSACHL